MENCGRGSSAKLFHETRRTEFRAWGNMHYFYSFYADSARIALQSILAHKLRAFLTLIGIIIGVAAVVVVGASVSGLNTYVTEKVAKLLGANHFMMARMAFQGQMTDDEYERRNRRNKRL